jgi:glycosyltransferase involved in cell wall biosynthesis
MEQIFEDDPIRYSIIIPSRGRPDPLKNCLQSIRKLDYPERQYEVIVVFDGDRENYNRFEACCCQLDLPLQIVFQERAGPAAARNLGARLARGKYLAFIDDDCQVPADWLTQADLTFEHQPDCMLGGKIRPAATADVYSAASHALLDAVYGFYNADSSHSVFFASCHMLMPKSAFFEIQGFDSNFWTAEDRDLCARWFSRGWPMLYQPSLAIQHDQRDSFGTFFQRHFCYGKGGYRFHLKQARQHHIPFQLAPKKFYNHLVSYSIKVATNPQNHRLVYFLIISQIASLLGFIFEALAFQFQLAKKHLAEKKLIAHQT